MVWVLTIEKWSPPSSKSINFDRYTYVRSKYVQFFGLCGAVWFCTNSWFQYLNRLIKPDYIIQDCRIIEVKKLLGMIQVRNCK